MKPQPLRVLLVDDHAVVRGGLRRFLEGPNVVCAEAASGEEAYALQAEFAPDVTVLDLALSGIGGIETLRKILARDGDAKVLVFSMHDSPSFVQQALRAGARGYVTKASTPDVLVQGIEAIAASRRFLSNDIAQSVAWSSIKGMPDPLACLTPREFDLFRMFADGKSIDEIAAITNLSSKTVGNYQTSIRQKLQLGTSAELVRLAIKLGVVSADRPSS